MTKTYAGKIREIPTGAIGKLLIVPASCLLAKEGGDYSFILWWANNPELVFVCSVCPRACEYAASELPEIAV